MNYHSPETRQVFGISREPKLRSKKEIFLGEIIL